MEDQKYELTINGSYKVELQQAQLAELDIVKKGDGQYHVLKDNKSYHVELISIDAATKTVSLKVNGKTYQTSIADHYDQLIKRLGLTTVSSQKVNQVKAPMPGLVLDILVDPGQDIKKGDKLLILEAMKMENIIKSSGDGIVEDVLIKKGTAVDKGQLLIQMK